MNLVLRKEKKVKENNIEGYLNWSRALGFNPMAIDLNSLQ